jgi:hypothetical protein
LRQNDPRFAVRTDANIPASDGSPRSLRQPLEVDGPIGATSATYSEKDFEGLASML